MPRERSDPPLTVGRPGKIRSRGAKRSLSEHLAPRDRILVVAGSLHDGYGRPVHPVAAAIAASLEAQAPADLVVVTAATVEFPSGVTRTPDLLIAGTLRRSYGPDEVLLAVEVEPTPDDRTSSPALYGEHGVPHVWRVTPDPPTIRVFALRGGVHQQVAASAHVIAHAPFRLQVDVAR